MPRLIALFLLVLAAQGAFWVWTREARVEAALVPPPPSERAVAALAFGDAQFLYRALTLRLQNMGDGGGRFPPLRDYDYGRLAGWFRRIEALDHGADFLPAVAGHYYGASPEPDQVRRMVTFLRAHAARDPARKWRWLAHAVYLARHRVGDLDLALAAAHELAALEVPDLPMWTRQMPAFVLSAAGEAEAARDLMAALLASTPDLSREEAAYMRDFIARMDNQAM